MSIVYQGLIDPWEYNYISNLVGMHKVPWSDRVAWAWYPEKRWLYDKLAVSLSQGLRGRSKGFAWPGSILRPRINLEGLGRGTRRVWWPQRIPPTHFTQRYLKGEYITTDFIVLDGEVVDFFTFRAQKRGLVFTEFESLPGRYSPAARKFVEKHIDFGVVNVETIGDTVIEVHLRPSLQFYDISGGLLSQLPLMYTARAWPRKATQEKTFSYVMRTSKNLQFSSVPNVSLYPGIRSVQFCYTPGIPLAFETQDEYTYRVAVINGSDKSHLQRQIKHIERELKRCRLSPIIKS